MSRSVLRFVLFTALLAAVPVHGPLQAQGTGDRYTIILRDVPLTEALEQVVAVTGLDLLFGSEVTDAAGDRRVFCRAEGETAEGVLACVVRSVDLDYYRLSSGTYVVIAGPEGLPRRGTLMGLVTDGWSGEPLADAQVRVVSPQLSTRANSSGAFSLPALLPGRHEVVVSVHGYEPLRTWVEVPPEGEARTTFSLEPRPFVARPIVVDGLELSGVAGVRPGMATLEASDIRTDARAGGDLSRSLPRLLGVASRPFLSEVLIQGGESVKQQLRLDGVPVYNPLAVEGIVGTFSPLALERVSVRKAGFPARFGSAAAGIVDLEQSVGGGRGTEVQVDPFNINARLGIGVPGAGGQEGSIMVAGRMSLWDVFPVPSLDRTLRDWNRVDPLLTRALEGTAPEEEGYAASEAVEYVGHGFGSEIRSSDLHLAFRIPTGPAGALRVSAFRGASEISTEVIAAGHHEGSRTADRMMMAQDGYDWSNTAGRVRWEGLMGARARSLLAVQVHGSRHRFESGYRMSQMGGQSLELGVDPLASAQDLLAERLRGARFLADRSQVEEVGAMVSLDHSAGSHHRLHFALEASFVDGEVDLDGGLFPHLRSEASHARFAGVVEDRWSRGAVTVEGGLRSTWLPDSDGLFHEPRVAVEWDGEMSGWGPVATRLSAGLYRQYVNQFELANPGPSAVVPFLRFWLPHEGSLATAPLARHLAWEVATVPFEGWEVRAEVYGRTTRNLPVVDMASVVTGGVGGDLRPSELVELSRGSAVGMGLRLKRSGDRLQAEVGHDMSRARRIFPSRFGGEAVPDPSDTPQRSLVRLEAAVGSNFSVRARGAGTWGRSWAFRRAYYDLLTLHEDRPELEVGRPGDWTLPALLEVDVGVSWRGALAGMGLEASADLLNVINRRNVLDYGLVRVADHADQYVRTPRDLSGFTPALTLRASF